MAEKNKNMMLSEVEKPVMAMQDFTDPEILHEQLIRCIKKYRPNTDLSMIEKAYEVATRCHEGQKRKSGEPYIIHPINVAIILADLELDKETIMAGLLHDVVEDTSMTQEELAREFGEEVALIVDGVTKLTKLNFTVDKDKNELQAENLRKMFLAMAKDIRVILVKLADRLHNMRTLEYQKPEKQQEKSRETLEIYSPLASRLGISKIKVELDDLAMRYLYPEEYKDLEEKIALSGHDREIFINNAVSEVRAHMKHADIDALVDGRVKHFFSIYRKMVNQHKTLDQIYDIFAVRIRVETVKDCYAALGVIHEMYKPIPGRFKDYIAMPKQNMYQSLHTTLISSTGQPFEIQIRTHEMHRIAEYGIAAHWKYKEGGQGTTNEQEKMAWLRQILEWQKDMDDNKEFVSSVKSDLNLFSEAVYCFTPTGDVKNLPAGSTVIDFAYSIHSAVGNKMVGARVNGRLVPIDYVLCNGDRVEIQTSQNSKGPSHDWLNIVKSAQAKNKINQWFKAEMKDENIVRGRELLYAYCKTKGITVSNIIRPEYQEKCMAKYSFRDWDSLLAAVGHGGLKESQVVSRLLEEYEKEKKAAITDDDVLKDVNETGSVNKARHDQAKKSGSGIVVKGTDDVAVRFSRCCRPVPGDEIVGYVTRGRGITIHRTDCVNMINLPELERNRLIEAEWEPEALAGQEKFEVQINIYANNRIGIIVDLSKILTERGIAITEMNSRINKQGKATINLAFTIKSKEELVSLAEKLRNVEGVLDIERANVTQ
ncbi:MAG: bifunctional (p)ppGpp synthetase/guanosine-3',5'-bis(diphosphate) 3'-pyrophosphohydrolase [Lachnospiraceae bacterium]|nr:bifunctional (p)ppGpp synthetase/guanosine-3',5'-bis(diphosphate) 3'-pyrophosphohydrolase [Lachnospiraceae bacterium]